jgi:hypothetical protein
MGNMTTPEDVAAKFNGANQRAWAAAPERTPREILRFLAARDATDHSCLVARDALSTSFAEIADRASRRMIWLTVGIFILTAALVALTIELVFKS